MEDPELIRLLVAAREGDTAAADEVVARHLPLVRALASRYAGRGEPLEDLVQVGSIGLLLAVKRFDPERGVAFRSFAIPTVVGEIRRHFRDRAWAMHVPRRLKELSLRLNRIVEHSTSELGRAPTVAELAAAADVTEEDVLDALDIANAYSTRSLDAPTDDGDEHVPRALGIPEVGYAAVEDAYLVDAGLDALDERCRRIVDLRFFHGLTQSEIAAQVGISQMHVSRLLRHSLEVMRSQMDEESAL